MKLSSRISRISESPTLAISSRAKELKTKGIDIINLGVGEPDFSTPEHIKRAAKEAIEAGFTNYTATVGIMELREVICENTRLEKGLNYDPNQVIVSSGAKNALFGAIQALVEEGDEVILPDPYWVSYPEQIKFAGARPVILETSEENNFKMTAEEFAAAISNKTKLLIINSPSNPTGAVYSKEELQEIAEIAIKHNIFIISDEIYRKVSYEEEAISIASLGQDIKKRTIIIDGVSKAYAMTGWRIGYALGPVEVIDAMGRLQSHSTSNANSIAQKAAVAAIGGSQDPTAVMVEAFKKRRGIIHEGINDISGMKATKPAGAFYLFVNVKELMSIKGVNSDEELVNLLLEEARVVGIPGSAFGKPGYIRFSYAASEAEIREFIKRLKEFTN